MPKSKNRKNHKKKVKRRKQKKKEYVNRIKNEIEAIHQFYGRVRDQENTEDNYEMLIKKIEENDNKDE